MRIRISAHPLLFIAGCRILKADVGQKEAILNLCADEKINLHKTELCDDGFYLLCSFFSSIRLISLASKNNIRLEILSSHGIPALVLRYRHRYGIVLGMLISVLLIFLSSSVIWDIRVNGANRLSDKEIISVLEECGLSLGTPRRAVDADTLANRVLIYSDDIAWISVNIIGTVAEVEIRELVLPTEPEELQFAASNIVAARSGKIVRFENISGNISAAIGETVSEGQLLIGGIYGDEENGFRYTSAKGKVFAEVERDFSVEIPRSEEFKSYSERTYCEKYLIFFKKRIKFFSNYRNLPISCDKIDMEERFPAPNSAELPLGIYTARYSEYEYKTLTRTDDELLELGYAQLDTLLFDELKDSELLSKQIETEISERGLILRCRVKCVENIAKESEIKIDGLP